MTVETQVNKVVANGNDVATSFSFSPMVIEKSSELRVVKRSTAGVETVLTEGTGTANYAVVVAKYPGTGSITFPASGTTKLATGEKLAMVRRKVLEQTTDLENQGGYFPEIQELQFDRLVMVDLQQQEQIDRSLKLAESDTAAYNVTMSIPAAGTYLYTADGLNFSWAAQSLLGGVTVTAFAQTFLDDANAAAVLTTLGASAAADADIIAIAALTSAADKMPYATGAGTWAMANLTIAGRALLDDASVAVQHTTLGLDGFVPRNFFQNGNFDVAQRAVLTTSANSLGDTIGSTAKLGKVDGWAVYSTAGTITAGSATQDAAATFGQTGNALHVSGLTMTGSAKIAIATRIESADAKQLRNKAIIVGLTLRHDIGSSKNVTITVNKPTATDNYAGVTQIAQSGALAVADATNVQVSLAISGATLGDCANGLEVIFELDCGAVTTKNIRAVDAFCILGTAVPATFPAEPFSAMLARCQRYFWKTFAYAQPPAQSISGGLATISGASPFRVATAGAHPGQMMAAPTGVTFNTAAANGEFRDETTAANGSGAAVQATENSYRITGIAPAAGSVCSIHAAFKAELY